ncbi:MAG: hypothetical protein ACKO96_42770, partial [Flammeovirgaceae bacterium]
MNKQSNLRKTVASQLIQLGNHLSQCSPVSGLGNALTARQHPDGRANFYIVLKNVAFTENTVVTSWSGYFWNTNPVQLLVYRYNGSWSVVGQSELVTPTSAGVQTFNLQTPIQAQKGDFVGLYHPKQGNVGFDVSGSYSSAIGVGNTEFGGSGSGPTDFSESSNRVYSVQVNGQSSSTIQPIQCLSPQTQYVTQPTQYITQPTQYVTQQPTQYYYPQQPTQYVTQPSQPLVQCSPVGNGLTARQHPDGR